MHAQISSKPVVQACNDLNFDEYLKKRTNKCIVSIYLVYTLVSEVKLSQTFIRRQVQEIFIVNF